MIAEAENLLTVHTKQGTMPMVRLRVEYTDVSQQINSARFGIMLRNLSAMQGRFFFSRLGQLIQKSQNKIFHLFTMDELRRAT